MAIRNWARKLKGQTLALHFAVRDPRTPWYAKVVAGLIVAYAVSPIDLIPDFIPVLGLVDELILLPAAIWFALRLVPPQVLEEARQTDERPSSKVAATVIILIWIALLVLCGLLVYRLAKAEWSVL